jgi:integrase
MQNCTLSVKLPINAAGEIWLENHKRYIKRITYMNYRLMVHSLAEFFGELPLGQVHIGNIRAYQDWRSKKAGALRVNQEIACLQMMLREIDRWRNLIDVYRPLPVPKRKVRQCMSQEEEQRLVVVALDSSKPRRRIAGHCLIVMANTSMGFGELRHLRREDVFLDEDIPHITVNGGLKNDFRERNIPLNFLALRSMRWLVKRWEKIGGTEPEQYILPHNARRVTPDPSHREKLAPRFDEPMLTIYAAARGILNDAGLSHLDPYDMRSHFITKLSEDSDVSDETYEQLTGHHGTRMRKRYARPRMIKKVAAVTKLCVEKEPAMMPRLIAFPGGKK